MDIAYYKQKIHDCLSENLRLAWMDDADWNDFLTLLFKECETDLDTMANEIIKGMDNGYSLEHQLRILTQILKPKA